MPNDGFRKNRFVLMVEKGSDGNRFVDTLDHVG